MISEKRFRNRRVDFWDLSGLKAFSIEQEQAEKTEEKESLLAQFPSVGIWMAEGAGFEPAVRLPARLISSQVPSTNSATLPVAWVSPMDVRI